MHATDPGNDPAGALVIRVAAGALVGTVVVYATPWILFAYPLPGLAMFAATLSAIAAGAISVLFHLRHRRSASWTDAAVSAVFGVVSVLEAALPLVADLVPGTATVAMWSRIIGRTVVALALLVIAWRRERVVAHPISVARGAMIVFGISALVVGWTLCFGHGLPAAVRGGTADELVRTPQVLTVRMAGAVTLLIAAAGFVRKARALGDRAMGLLAGGAVLMATARVHDFLHPSLRDDWMTTGDTIRLIAYWLVVVGLLRQTGDLWRARQTDALDAERRRVAAEIHDGIAQDLAFIRSQTSLIVGTSGDDAVVSNLQLAADRALSEARRVIVDYGSAGRPCSLGDALTEVAHEVELRHGHDLRFDLDLDLSTRVDGHTAHELRRIVGEAFQNAAQHAHARHISARLVSDERRIRVVVSDDGLGLPPHPEAAGRYGLTGMRQRAMGLGGSFGIESAPGGGTTVRIEVPVR